MRNTRIIKQGQSLLDVALCETGTADAAFAIALQNGLSLTDEPQAGTPISHALEKKQIYSLKNEPATAITAGEVAKPEGIGYWIIGQNFKVS